MRSSPADRIESSPLKRPLTHGDYNVRMFRRQIDIFIRIIFDVEQMGIQYMRCQFALSLAYAMTAHKCQGDTLDEVIVDFRPNDKNKSFITNGSFYVAITRVQKATKLWLRSFDKKMIKTDPKIEPVLNSMKLHYQYKMKKIYVEDEIFTDECVKVGYLNINGLLHAYHAEYVNGDKNHQHLDILALGESHLTMDTSTAVIENIMTDWTVIHRSDAHDGKKHMGILLLGSKRSNKWKNISILTAWSTAGVQCIECEIEGQTFSFIYCRQTPSLGQAQNIAQSTARSDYLMGDLNLNPLNVDDQEKLSTICGGTKKVLLREITTKNKIQLDHILGVEKENVKVYTTSFQNFASDHHSIIVRVSAQGAEYLPDDRLNLAIERPHNEETEMDVEQPSSTKRRGDTIFKLPQIPQKMRKRK